MSLILKFFSPLLNFKRNPNQLSFTASSTAVLVQLTPILGALIGLVVTLFLIAVSIVVCIKFRRKRINREIIENNVNERDKGSSEPLSRNMGSHTSIEDKNPDVVPQENSEDDEKQFDRLKIDTERRIIYTPSNGLNISPTLPRYSSPMQQQLQQQQLQSPTSLLYGTTTSNKQQYGELSLTTNPTYSIYNSPQQSRQLSPTHHHYQQQLQQQQQPSHTTTATTTTILRSPPNIYSRIPPLRNYTTFDTRTTRTTSPNDSNGYCVTIPLLSPTKNNQTSLSFQQPLIKATMIGNSNGGGGVEMNSNGGGMLSSSIVTPKILTTTNHLNDCL